MVRPLMGIDMGNETTKVVSIIGRDAQHELVPSLVLPVPEAYNREQSDLARRTTLDTLDVTIHSNAVQGASRWLVGNILTRETNLAKLAQRSSERDQKAGNTKLYVTGLTALAVLTRKRFTARQETVRVPFLTASLPASHYSAETKAEVIRRLKGIHLVRFNQVEGIPDGSSVEMLVEKVGVIPEGMGAALTQLYRRQDGKTVEINPELHRTNFAVCDVGGRTTDFVFFGPGLDYQESMSGTSPYGVADALAAILRDARREAGDDTVFRNDRELVEVLTRGDFMIPVRRSEMNLRPIMDRHLKPLATKVAADIQSRWETRVREFFLVGGGATLIQPYLRLPPDYAPTMIGTDAQLANALGNCLFSARNAEHTSTPVSSQF